MSTTWPNTYQKLSRIGEHMDICRADARQRWRSAPLKRLRAEIFCFLLVWIPHEHNNLTRKVATLILFGGWILIEVGAAFGFAMFPDHFIYIRGFVLILLGRMWGLELNNFAGVEVTQSEDYNGDESE